MSKRAIAVRPIRSADRDAWQRMRAVLWPAPADDHAQAVADFFTRASSRPAAVLIACEAERTIGFVELSIRPYAEGCTTERVAYVEGWYVEPAVRGRGAGAALMAAAEDWARAQGCTELASDTELDNAASAAAHRALGFAETGRIVCFRKLIARAAP